MIEYTEVKHHIQKHILSVLQRRRYGRFRDLRPPRIDTNLYSYHLKLLLKSGMVKKTDLGYTLGAAGLTYVDRVTAVSHKLRIQPKIVTMLLVQDGFGKVLLMRRDKQPYIDSWTLPYGKFHLDDTSVMAAGKREARDKLGLEVEQLRHVGDCYIRVTQSGELQTMTLVHVLRLEIDEFAETDRLKWVKPLQLGKLELAPAVEQIITRAFFGDEFFFEEFTENI